MGPSQLGRDMGGCKTYGGRKTSPEKRHQRMRSPENFWTPPKELLVCSVVEFCTGKNRALTPESGWKTYHTIGGVQNPFLSEDFSLLVAFDYSLLFRGFSVALFCLEKQCSGLFRGFFVAPVLGKIYAYSPLEQSSDFGRGVIREVFQPPLFSTPPWQRLPKVYVPHFLGKDAKRDPRQTAVFAGFLRGPTGVPNLRPFSATKSLSFQIA